MPSLATSTSPPPARGAKTAGPRRALRHVVGLPSAVAIVAALSRYLLPEALHHAVAVPFHGSYATEQLPVLAQHPVLEAVHRLGGVLYILIGLSQLSRGAGAKRSATHRRLGDAFVALTLVAGVSGAYMAVAFPYDDGERAPSLLFGAWMVVAALVAVREARNRRYASHRVWMMRSFAVGLGIATIRVLAVVALHTTPWSARQLITPIFWISWIGTVAVAELLIRRVERVR